MVCLRHFELVEAVASDRTNYYCLDNLAISITHGAIGSGWNRYEVDASSVKARKAL